MDNKQTDIAKNQKYYCKNYELIQTIKKTPKRIVRYILGQVSIVRNEHKKYFIAKRIEISDEKVSHEVKMFQSVNHPNIVRMEESFIQLPWLYIIEEYCEEGDLAYHIARQIRKKKKCFSQEILQAWLLQTLLAIQYLHHSQIIHRDIRPQNIFLTASGNIKLGSFKLSKVLDSQLDYAQTILGSSYYMAPQLAENQGYDKKIDIWAFGCLIYELCSLRPLFQIQSSNIIEVVNRISKGKIDDIPVIYSKQLNLLFHKCMKKKSHERASAKQLLKGSYFLEAMQKFIKFRGLNLQDRIPIKRYKVHKNNISKTRIKSAIKEVQKVSSPVFEVQSYKYERKNSRERQSSREKRPYSKQKSTNSKERLQKLQNLKEVAHTPIIYQKITRLSQQKRQKSSSKQKKTTIKNPKQTPPNVFKGVSLLAPPMLPRPEKKNPSPKTSESKITQSSSHSPKQQPYSQENINKQFDIENSEGIDFNKKDKNQVQAQICKVNTSLNKLFNDLNIKEQNQNQFSFDLEEESQVRLTNKNFGSQEQLVSTYNNMLQALIDEINYKYCPDMESIQETNNQFDSNSFANHQYKP